MKDVGAACRTLLVANPLITDVVGPRVYSDQLPQGAASPAIVYEVIYEEANDVLSGPLGMESAVITVHAFGKTRSEANSLHFDIKKTLAGFRGTAASVVIREVSQDSGLGYGTDQPEAGSDARRYITSQDFAFVYGSLEKSC